MHFVCGNKVQYTRDCGGFCPNAGLRLIVARTIEDTGVEIEPVGDGAGLSLLQ
jgi:hypothetical protein